MSSEITEEIPISTPMENLGGENEQQMEIRSPGQQVSVRVSVRESHLPQTGFKIWFLIIGLILRSESGIKRLSDSLLNVFDGISNFASIIGAFVCDTYLGRYKTLMWSSLASIMGLTMISLTSVFGALHPPPCDGGHCHGPTSLQWSFLAGAFLMLTVGAAGIRPSSVAFGADQFDKNTDAGKRANAKLFNWNYISSNLAQILSLTVIVFIQLNVGWGVGLAIPALMMFFAWIVFLSGNSIYVKVRPTGSPVKSILRVFVVAVKNRRVTVSQLPPGLTDRYSFLNKAAIMTRVEQPNPSDNPWNICSVREIEDCKTVVGLLPIAGAAIFYFVALSQQNQYAVFQALQSKRHLFAKFQLPAASINISITVFGIIFLAIYENVIVKSLRNRTGNPTGVPILHRIGFGITALVASSFLSALFEWKRKGLVVKNPSFGHEPQQGQTSQMSVFWLIPQLMLVGVAQSLAGIGLSSFYYDQMPDDMKSFSGSFIYCGTAAGNLVYGLIVTILHQSTTWLANDINKGRLDIFYLLIGSLGLLNLGFFVVCAKRYVFRQPGVTSGIEMEDTTM